MAKRSFGSKMAEFILLYVSRPKTTDIKEYRKYLESLNKGITVKPPVILTDIKNEMFEGMQILVFNNKQKTGQKTILYLHGGAYIHQPLQAHYFALQEFATKLDAKIIMPIYFKAPRFSYKDNYHIIVDLYKKILSQTPSEKIIFMGDSAGGGFVLSLAQYLRNENIAGPKRIVLFSPWLDLNTNNPEIAKYEKDDPMLASWELQVDGEYWANGKENMNNYLVSPIFGSFANLGRISIFVGTREIFYPEVMKLCNILKSDEIDYDLFVGKEQNHVYVLYPIKEGQDARKKVIKLLSKD